MKNRYEVRRGRFGAYFYDTVDDKKLDLAETVCALNVLYNEHSVHTDRKISETAEAVEQPITGDKTAETSPEGEITPPFCGGCANEGKCDCDPGGEACHLNFVPA